MKTKLEMGVVVSSESSSYELVHRLGHGGMGEVWEALDLSVAVHVAIKFLRVDTEALRCRFYREAKLLRGLDHPDIVRFIDNGETLEGEPFLVLELLSGETLSTWLMRYGALPVRSAVEIAHVVARALTAAHEVGIVHRDLKPGNVFMQDEQDNDGLQVKVKVFDFGIAKDLSASSQTFATDMGAMVGTPANMAPEQALGKHVGFQADVWALGMLLFEMIEGRRMFSGSSVEVLDKVINEPIVPIRWSAHGVPKKLDALVASCLQRDLRKRIASVHEVELALRELLDSGNASQVLPPTVDVQRAAPMPQPVPFDASSTIPPIGSTISDSIAAQTRIITAQYFEVQRQVMFLKIGGAALVLLNLAQLLMSRPTVNNSINFPAPPTASPPAQSPLPSSSALAPEPAPPVPSDVFKINVVPKNKPCQGVRYISGCRY